MSFEIIGSMNTKQLFCAGSFTKLITTYVSLSFLSEQYNLENILDDSAFLTSISTQPATDYFLSLFQKYIGGPFTIRDLCSFYTGLPYTFDVAQDELEKVDAGHAFKHHSILQEKMFLDRCQHKITPVYHNRCKFHYSELAIIFLGYFIENAFDLQLEELYEKYIFKKLSLKQSLFARKRPEQVRCQDLSDQYDYPSIAILDHGYFCYSNGYYTTLAEMKILLDQLIHEPVFQHMTDLSKARAASHTIMNGLTVELRRVGDDLLYGYEGLSYSGCNIFAYSTKHKKGFLSLGNDEEAAYEIYAQFGYSNFDKVTAESETLYQQFIHSRPYQNATLETPPSFQGSYQRVLINEKILDTIFHISKNTMTIRNPDEITYELVYANGAYRVKGKDGSHGAKVDFIESNAGNRYFSYDGTLYKKITEA